jgi:hypothetical protein
VAIRRERAIDRDRGALDRARNWAVTYLTCSDLRADATALGGVELFDRNEAVDWALVRCRFADRMRRRRGRNRACGLGLERCEPAALARNLDERVTQLIDAGGCLAGAREHCTISVSSRLRHGINRRVVEDAVRSFHRQSPTSVGREGALRVRDSTVWAVCDGRIWRPFCTTVSMPQTCPASSARWRETPWPGCNVWGSKRQRPCHSIES